MTKETGAILKKRAEVKGVYEIKRKVCLVEKTDGAFAFVLYDDGKDIQRGLVILPTIGCLVDKERIV
jgi:hypothetical protein